MRKVAVGCSFAALLLAGCAGGDGGSSSGDASDRRIAFFRASGNGRYDFATATSRGRGIRVLTGRARPGSAVPALFARPAWSPDGTKIAFAAGRGARTDIYVMDADGGHQRRITRLRDAFEPLWSPDGRTIIFTRVRADRHAGLSGALWEVALRRAKVRQVTTTQRRRLDTPGAFSADGRTLLFTRLSCVSRRSTDCIVNPAGKTTAAVYAARPDGSRARRLIRNGTDPAFSPDASKIAFVSARDRNGLFTYGEVKSSVNELYVANADGTHQRRLTRTRDLDERNPSWRDGSRIAFEVGEEIENAEGTSLIEINADGTCRRTILSDPKLDTWYARPAWQPTDSGGATAQRPCEGD